MCICKLLCYVSAHLCGVAQVAFVADQDSGHLLAQGMLTALLNPCRKATETSSIGDVIDKHHSVDVAVVVLHHTLTEALLTCGVPQLDLVEGKKGKQLAVKLCLHTIHICSLNRRIQGVFMRK